MAVNDPIADFLTRIRNGQMSRLRFVDIGWSKMKESLANILKDKGFIENFLVKKDENQRGTIRVFLKYSDGRRPVIRGLKRISTPGLRRYVACDEIPSFFGGLGLSIISTSQGVMAGRDASQRRLGGELLCMVW